MTEMSLRDVTDEAAVVAAVAQITGHVPETVVPDDACWRLEDRSGKIGCQLESDGSWSSLQVFALRDVEIRGATWYDADPEDGRPDTLAVDLRAAYAEPVLVCGYLVWSMEGANPALRREELGVVEGAAIAGMTEAERDAAYARMGCR